MTSFGLFVSLVLGLVASPQQDGLESSFWNQPFGDAMATGSVEVEPPRTAPEVVWRRPWDADAVEPVVWGDHVFLLTPNRARWRVVALDLDTGEETAHMDVGKGDGLWLAVWQGYVVVGQVGEVQLLLLNRKGRFQRKKTFRDITWWLPAVEDGWLYATTDRRLVALDLQKGRLLSANSALPGRPSVGPWGVGIASYDRIADPKGQSPFVLTVPRPEDSPRDWSEVEKKKKGKDDPPPPARREVLEGGVLVPFVADPTKAEVGTWYVNTGQPQKTARGDEVPAALVPSRWLSPLLPPIVAWKGRLVAWTDDRPASWTVQDASGSFDAVLLGDQLPAGAVPSGTSRAGSVAFPGNFAFDLDLGEVLWVLDDLHPVGSLLPAGDRRLLARTADGELVLFESPADLGVVADAAVLAPGAAPDRASGLVLRDGRFRTGQPARAPDGSWTLDGDTTAALPESELAAVLERTDVQVFPGGEWPLTLAWRSHLDGVVHAGFEELMRLALDERLTDEFRRLMTEAESWRLPADQRDALLAAASGVTQRPDAYAKAARRKLAEREAEVRADLEARFLEAADWCAAFGQVRCATVLVLDAERLRPGLEPDRDRVADWIPDDFPFAGRPDTVEQWLRWTPELLPADGRLAPSDDPAWEFTDDLRWRSQGLLVLTPHLRVATRCLDPAVVGRVVRSGEDAVRVLSALFPDAAGGERLLVWFFRDRRDYLSMPREEGGSPPEWTAGFYSPDDHASFFFPQESGSEALEELDLASVVAHELTHHFIGERIQGEELDPAALLRWVAEGFATFVEEQVVRPRAAGLPTLDDPLALSLDVCTSLLANDGELLPLDDLLVADGMDFYRLDGETTTYVPLTHRGGSWPLSDRTLFYSEAGALCFFLWNHAGEEGRARFLEVLRRAYRGEDLGDSDAVARLLGWDDAPALEEEFTAFLRGGAQSTRK